MKARKLSRRELEKAFLDCHVNGHRWDEITGIHRSTSRRVTFAWRQTHRCTTCTTLRHQAVNYRGDIVSRSYDYPEGYSSEKTTRAEFRQEWAFREGHIARRPRKKAS